MEIGSMASDVIIVNGEENTWDNNAFTGFDSLGDSEL
jgi:hypothetical protein